MAADPYKYFRIEARDLVEQLGQGALALERDVPSGDLVSRLLRLAHTLKGAARVVRQPQIAEIAHQLEDLFAPLRESAERPPRELIDRTLALLDQIGAQVTALSPERPAETPQVPGARELEARFEAFRPDVTDMDALVAGLTEAQTQLGVLRPRVDDANRIRHLIELTEDQLGTFRVRDTLTPGDRSALDKVRSMIEELRGRFGGLERSVAYGIDQIDRELHQVSERAARLRLVPASAVFQFLERATRDTAQALGKQVVFETRGGDVRLDGGVLAIVQGALLQVARNAVAHGIESREERLAAGKTAEGHVTIDVSRRGASVSFQYADDGRGVNFDAVQRMLQRRPGAKAAAGGRDVLLRRLLKGGITTSDTVTQVSGRGIGLTVVNEAAERLGGKVSMRSDPGKGTVAELVVPASLASFPALLVEVGGITAAVPLETVRRTLRVMPDDLMDSAQGSSIVHDGVSVPIWSLPQLARPPEALSRGTRSSSAVIVDVGEGSAALAVDRVIGTATIVMRPLPDLAPAVASVVGASLDAVGQPRLVLDPAVLVAEAARLGGVRRDPAPAKLSILVVDDSLTTRMLEQSILESAGYDVSLATSGEEGLEKARAGRFALFLVDVEMPGMDGFAFIEQVRADPVLRDTPAILVTSRASADDLQRGHDVGAAGYVVKGDFDQRALLERIKALVH
jgi:two-component system, chemotaxis family, sensor kinase CheA